MVYMYTLWMGSTNFTKTLRQFQKPRRQKCDIKGVHNLTCRHCLGLEVHMISKYFEYVCHLTQNCKWLSLQWTLDMTCTVHMPFGGCTHWYSDCIIETIKHDILNVSKSVAWYQKYMHIKACIAMGNAPRAWGQDKMTFILYLGGSTILWLKGTIIIIYCPSCWNQCKRWYSVISGMKYWGMFPTSVTIRLYTREVLGNRYAPCDYTYTVSSLK